MRVVFVVVVCIVLFGFGITKAYVSYLRNLQSTLGQRWFTRGEEAISRSYPLVAMDDYRNALAYDEGNQQYRLRLAEALISDGKLAEARANLLSLWSQRPADGRLNLDLARLYAEQNNPDLAVRYYRAAIDGVWSDDPVQQRLDTRFELVRYLMQQGDRARAIAELIGIQAEAPDNPAALKQAGGLLLHLGEYGRAAKSYDSVLKENSRDATALLGAGQAALALGDYTNAVRLLTEANDVSGEKGKGPSADELALARETLNSDPYLRKLTLSERARRVAAAFVLAMARLQTCAARGNISLEPQPPATAGEPSKPVLPSQKNGNPVPLPAPAAPNSLQMLYDSGLQRQPTATVEALRKNPDTIGPAMDFVLDVMRATQSNCPLTTVPERALQLTAQHEAENAR